MEIKIIPSLNGLRAISIIIVILSHLVENAKLKMSFPILKLFWNGSFGVNVFFVLSGFLITSLMIKEHTINNNISLKKFYLRRTIRIFPAYYFLLFTYFILQLLDLIDLTRLDWISSITYTRQFFSTSKPCLHLWSLSVEEFFYLIFPLSFILFYKNPKLYSLLLGVIVLLVFPLFRVAGHHFLPNTSGFNIFYRGDALLIGCLLALNYNYIKKIICRFHIPFLGYILILILFQQLPLLIDSNLFYILLGKPGVSIFDNIIIALIIVACIENITTIYFRILNSKVLNYIGILSYSLYLWQQIFTGKEVFGFENLFSYNLILLFLAAVFSHHIIERPFLMLKNKYGMS